MKRKSDLEEEDNHVFNWLYEFITLWHKNRNECP